MVELTPPSDVQLHAAMDWQIQNRSIIRKADLSIVERVRLVRENGSEKTVILKTTRSMLGHERKVYRLLERFRICAVALFMYGGSTNAASIWFLLEDIGDSIKIDMSKAIIGQVLEDLAAVHSHYLDRPDDLNDIPRRDSKWLASSSEEILRRLLDISTTHNLELGNSIDLFQQKLEYLGRELSNHPLTIVHGDFDLGNLHYSPSGQIAALDWGLSHINIPFIDLAHMVEPFDKQEQLKLADQYIQALGTDLGYSPSYAIKLGAIAHQVFFVWWHSLVIKNNWGNPGIILRL